jgi:hypothetical protein
MDELITSVRIAYGRTALPFTVSQGQIFNCEALSVKGKIRFSEDKITMIVPQDGVSFDGQLPDEEDTYWVVSINARELWSD